MNSANQYTTGRNYSYFGQVPQNFAPTNYRLSKSAVESSAKIFELYDRNRTGYITIGELEPVLKDTFGVDNMPPPASSDIAYLLDKYDFNNDRQLTKREFRRLIKELSGTKKYDKNTINTQNKKGKFGHKTTTNAIPIVTPGHHTTTNTQYAQPPIQNAQYAQPPIQNTQYVQPPVQNTHYVQPPVQNTQYVQPPVQHAQYAQAQPQNVVTTTTYTQETHVVKPPVYPGGVNQQYSGQQQVHATPISTATYTPRSGAYPIFGQVPQNHSAQTYGLSRNAIKRSRTLFKQYDSDNDGYLTYNELNAALGGVFALDGLQPPLPNDVAYLLDKYDFDYNHKLSSREFKRMLKELSGTKRFDRTNISAYRYDRYNGPSPVEPGFIAPVNTAPHRSAFANPPIQQNMQSTPHYTAPPTNYVQKHFVLSNNAIRHSKNIFRKYDTSNTGQITASQLDNVVREVFVLDHQQAPSSIDVANVLYKYEYQNRQLYTEKEVKRILKDLTGAKTYNKSTFGFFSRVFR